MTSAGPAPLAPGPATPTPPAAAALPALSAASARHPAPRPPFLAVAADRLGSRDCQKGVRQERQGDMPVPPHPLAYFVLVQPHFPFARLKSLFYRPACSRHLHQRLEARRCRGKGE